MKKKLSIKSYPLLTLVVIMLFYVMVIDVEINATENKEIIVVTLGDSYSAGEGIEPFYGQYKVLDEKTKDENWLSHRSTKSWGSMLEIPGVEGTLGEYFTVSYLYDKNNDTDSLGMKKCKWYFKASSGAETWHVIKEKQDKTYAKPNLSYVTDGIVVDDPIFDSYALPIQTDVFDEIDANGEKVDYVTITIGGNDAGFFDIIYQCATSLETAKLQNKINSVWNRIEEIEKNIVDVYEEIRSKTNNEAKIIVAGYPTLLSKYGGTGLVASVAISNEESAIINNAVIDFNNHIERLVEDCHLRGMNIYFVDVEEEFAGHEAYTMNPWINEIILGARSQDLDYTATASYYSIHPNEKGAQAYARCVNKKIEELENHYGTISGKVSSAEGDKAIAGVKIEIYKLQDEYGFNEELWSTVTSDETGHFSNILPEGNYRLEISADNYITFSAYATVTAGQTMDMETLFMVESGNVAKGTVSGVISDYSTGSTIRRGSIIVRKGYNNTKHGEAVIFRAISSYGSGKYQLELEPGNYTLYIQSYSYAPKHVNVAVSPGGVIAENVALKSIGSDGYRIVLTWGANPRNLNSHIVENNAQHGELHVYYMTPGTIRSHLDNCELDVDDKDGYGPETITLVTYNTAEAKNTHYYYYVHLYEGVGTLASSNAQVKIYKDGVLIATRNVPTNLGDDKYWNVFAIVGGEIVYKDTITSTPDTSYAKSIAEGESRTILAMSEAAVLATDSEAIIATDSEARLATGSEAMVDVDDETLHDKYDAIKENIGDEDDMKETMLTIQENSSDTTNISRRTRLY